MSETAAARDLLIRFCHGDGVDLGFGGDKIKPSAIAMDQPRGYTKVGEDAVQLHGDARNLHWFKDGVLDYVYSSHLLEDFTLEETVPVMKEWTRVLKKSGRLILLLPDEPTYRAHCDKTGQHYNQAHKIDYFGIDYVRGAAFQCNLKEIYYSGIINTYSFAVIFEKI